MSEWLEMKTGEIFFMKTNSIRARICLQLDPSVCAGVTFELNQMYIVFGPEDGKGRYKLGLPLMHNQYLFDAKEEEQ